MITYEDTPAVIRAAGEHQGAMWPMLADCRLRHQMIAFVLGTRAVMVGLFCLSVERAEVRRA